MGIKDRKLVCKSCGIIIEVSSYHCGHDEDYTCSRCRGVVYEKKRKQKVEVISNE